MTSESINNAEKSDQTIVNLCIENRRDAWELFFTRFHPLMLNSIKSTLYGYGEFGERMARDEGVLWDVFEILYDRFRDDSLLEKCKNLNGIRSWLATVAANQTKDWMKAKFTDDELPNRHAENSMTSLDQPLYDDSNMTLLDTDLSEADFEESLQDLLIGQSELPLLEEDYAAISLARISFSVLVHLSKLSQSNEPNHLRNFWIARINYFATYPLDDQEIDDLVEFTKSTRCDLLLKIDNVMKGIADREVEKEAALGRAEIIRHKLLRSQAKLGHYRNDPTLEGKQIRVDLEKKIESMSKRRSELLHKGLKVLRPSAKEILEILILPPKMENQVSTILARLQQDLLDVLKEQLNKSD